MISQTTLEMVVRAVDRASGPLDAVQGKVDDLSGSVDKSAGSVTEYGDAFEEADGKIDQYSETTDKAIDRTDELGESAESAGKKIGPEGMASLVALAVTAFALLAVKLKEVYDEHKRVSDLAERLDLPVDEVKNYDDAWIGVAESLNDVARGFASLGEAQTAAFNAFRLDPQAGAKNIQPLVTRLAAAEGDQANKVDILRIAFGISQEKAEQQLNDELERLRKQVLVGTEYDNQGELRYIFKTNADIEGVKFGKENVDQLREQLKTENDLRAAREKDAEFKRKMGLVDKELAAQEKARAEASAEAAKADRIATDNALMNLHDLAAASREWYDILGLLQDEQTGAIEKVNQDIDKYVKESMKQVDVLTEQVTADLAGPYDGLVDSTKSALEDMAREADFSFKHLIERIISYLLQKRLFDAIDKIGNALNDAFSLAGGGGFLGKALKFISGNAGGGTASGVRLVGEDGPELVGGGINTFKVYNERQMAFAGAGATGGSRKMQYNDNRVYHLSGVDTAQMIAYIEAGREQDRNGTVQMMYDNGLGRMR